MSLSDLYQEIILDHYKNPRHFGELEDPDLYAEDNNPSCGDELQVEIDLSGDEQTVRDVRFSGQGCAISMASGSLMADRITGQSVDSVRRLREQFKAMITSDDDAEDELRDELGDLVSLKGVIKFPIRIKCADLAWNTLQKALDAYDEQGLPVRVVQND